MLWVSEGMEVCVCDGIVYRAVVVTLAAGDWCRIRFEDGRQVWADVNSLVLPEQVATAVERALEDDR